LIERLSVKAHDLIRRWTAGTEILQVILRANIRHCCATTLQSGDHPVVSSTRQRRVQPPLVDIPVEATAGFIH
jgi:hypothetical protein